MFQINICRLTRRDLSLEDITRGDGRCFRENYKEFKSKPKESHYDCPKEKPGSSDKKILIAVKKLIRVRLPCWKTSTHFKEICKYENTTEILYSKGSEGPWIRLEKVSKFTSRTELLSMKVSQQYPTDTSFTATATCINGYNENLEGAFF